MVGHGTVRPRNVEGMEGDSTTGAPGAMIEWIIRLALFALAVAAVWTVFGDDIAQLLGR
jgi:hypothetical protein